MKKLGEIAEKFVVGHVEFSPYAPNSVLPQRILSVPMPQVIPPKKSQHGDLKGKDSLQNSSPKEKFSSKDKAQLSIALSHICEMQKAYGKTITNLETIVNGFLWALDGYPMIEILQGLKECVKRQNDIPTPADIIAIIDPPKQPLCGRVYSKIKQRLIDGHDFVSNEERDYCRKYEQQEIAKAR